MNLIGVKNIVFSPIDYGDLKGGYSVSYEQAILTKALRSIPH
jgi:hypothetical protein